MAHGCGDARPRQVHPFAGERSGHLRVRDRARILAEPRPSFNPRRLKASATSGRLTTTSAEPLAVVATGSLSRAICSNRPLMRFGHADLKRRPITARVHRDYVGVTQAATEATTR